MKYKNIKKAVFCKRPNRFIAICEVNGCEDVVHVKNTGRCRELLIKGATVFLEENNSPARKTKYDLISVIKDGRLINMDSHVRVLSSMRMLQNTKMKLKIFLIIL